MATTRQVLGKFGETRVVKDCGCPRCKRPRTLVKLPLNFKCADVICDFCGYLAQVKAATVKCVDEVPKTILGAAWGPQRERMESGIYFPLFLVLATINQAQYAIYYLSADLQRPEMFKARNPLSATARRAGWTGFLYDLQSIKASFVRLR
ncbi:DpnI domain-containing protein [Roseomonas gilardii]|uniref:DpnI domain-containing protein n=1 Tax=Roseomonas gilardii TaxID=257708 RepID=UPI0011A2D67B